MASDRLTEARLAFVESFTSPHSGYREVIAEVRACWASLARQREMLVALEFCVERCCPICEREHSHRPDCRLGALIGSERATPHVEPTKLEEVRKAWAWIASKGHFGPGERDDLSRLLGELADRPLGEAAPELRAVADAAKDTWERLVACSGDSLTNELNASAARLHLALEDLARVGGPAPGRPTRAELETWAGKMRDVLLRLRGEMATLSQWDAWPKEIHDLVEGALAAEPGKRCRA